MDLVERMRLEADRPILSSSLVCASQVKQRKWEKYADRDTLLSILDKEAHCPEEPYAKEKMW